MNMNTNIISTSNHYIKTKNINGYIETRNTFDKHIPKNKSKTSIQTKNINGYIETRNTFDKHIPKNKEINKIVVQQDKPISLISYINKKKYNIYLHKLVNKGSYNNIYYFSKSNFIKPDPNLIIRISNDHSQSDILNSELTGIKIQYNLSSKSKFIGVVVDYGQLYNPTKNPKLQEYSIMKQYGITLNEMLTKTTLSYSNINVVIQFMYNLLYTIHTIHKNNYIHLDLKPENILLDKSLINYNNIENIDFVVVDFGGAKCSSTNKSKIINGQMASAAFSPPEVINIKFGRKSDIWAYGVICYLVCVKKTFIEASGNNIFMNKNKIQLKQNIDKAINHLHSDYNIIKPFLKSIFIMDIDKRPNCKTLLLNKIFSIFN